MLGRSTLLDLSDYAADSTLASLTASSASALEAAGTRRTGTLSGQWESDVSLTRQTDTLDLVGEALLWAAEADAALVRPPAWGSSRWPVSLAGTPAPRLSPWPTAPPWPRSGVPVVTVSLTGAQLRQWLETCAGRYTVTDAGQPAGGEDACFLYGMDYALYLGGAEGRRVAGLSIQGAPVTDEQVFTVALSAALLDDPEFPDCTVLWSARRRAGLRLPGRLHRRPAGRLRRGPYPPGPHRLPRPLQRLGSLPGGRRRFPHPAGLCGAALRPGRPAQPGASVAFMDVEDSSAVVWAAETGIVTGNGRGSFLPLDPVDREQAAVMIYNYALRVGGAEPVAAGEELAGLLDGLAVSAWARPAVEFCLAGDIIPAAGTRGDLYLPASPVTRHEAQYFLAQLADYLE